MKKGQILSKVREIVDADTQCGLDIYVCLDDEKQGFYLEKMVSKNCLKDKVRTIALDVIKTQYMEDDNEYCGIEDVVDNKKAIYILEQSDEYKPFAVLNEALDNISNFDEANIGHVLGFIFKLNFNSKKLFLYQHAYVGSKLQVKNTLRIMQKEKVFAPVEKEMLKIDKRGEIIIIDNILLVKKINVLQDYFGFQQFVRQQAQETIDNIEKMELLEGIDLLREYQNGEKITISKKLMKIKNSPVLEMDKEQLLNKIPKIPRYSKQIHIENGYIQIKSKKDVDNLLKLLNDDIVKSELTNKEYDSTAKKLLPSEKQEIRI